MTTDIQQLIAAATPTAEEMAERASLPWPDSHITPARVAYRRLVEQADQALAACWATSPKDTPEYQAAWDHYLALREAADTLQAAGLGGTVVTPEHPAPRWLVHFSSRVASESTRVNADTGLQAIALAGRQVGRSGPGIELYDSHTDETRWYVRDQYGDLREYGDETTWRAALARREEGLILDSIETP